MVIEGFWALADRPKQPIEKLASYLKQYVLSSHMRMSPLRILREGYNQAAQQLWSNRLRSFLSLLGISIGIFCIIAVLSAVDSLESNIRESVNKLGDDVVYVSKLPWGEDPNQNYWKYIKRPNPSYEDFKRLAAESELAQYVSMYFVIGLKPVKYLSNYVDRGVIFAATYDLSPMFNIQMDKGRWFSNYEYTKGTDVAIVGYNIAEALFGTVNPIGKNITVSGRKLRVIGVVEKSGNSLINPTNWDDCVMVSYPTGGKMSNLKSRNPFNASIQMKAKAGVDIDALKDEATILLRRARRIAPKVNNSFALNTLTIISNLFDSVFNVLSIAGWIIGFFSIVVGAFSVANIMFVSVRERTGFIGIKKAIGAKSYVILYEFLVESVVLCLVGGLIGLAMVWVVMQIMTHVWNFEMFLSIKNISIGLVLSIIIGVGAGLIPAFLAARMDPVRAIRFNG